MCRLATPTATEAAARAFPVLTCENSFGWSGEFGSCWLVSWLRLGCLFVGWLVGYVLLVGESGEWRVGPFVRASTPVRSPARSFVRSSVRLSIRSFVRPFVRSFVRSSIRSFVRPFVRSCVRSFVRSVVPPFCILSFLNLFWPLCRQVSSA